MTPRPWEMYAGTFGWNVRDATGTESVCAGATEEDARLIAAAPDLFEAARLVLEAWRDNRDPTDQMIGLEDALARAVNG